MPFTSISYENTEDYPGFETRMRSNPPRTPEASLALRAAKRSRDACSCIRLGLATSHAYRDGNKRIAFLAMAVFLELNGYRLEAPEPEVVQVMVGVAAKRVAEPELAEWLRRHMVLTTRRRQ